MKQIKEKSPTNAGHYMSQGIITQCCLRKTGIKKTQSQTIWCNLAAGSMWRLSPLVGVRPLRSWKENPHHVSAEGAVRSRGGEAPHRAPHHSGERRNQGEQKPPITSNIDIYIWMY